MINQKSSLFISLLIAAAYILNITYAIEPAIEGGDHIIELYLHDILGGTNPTARPVTGLLGNIYSGQVPFARPVGLRPNGVAIPNANGAVPTLTVNGIPLGTGLAGTSFAGSQNNGRNVATQVKKFSVNFFICNLGERHLYSPSFNKDSIWFPMFQLQQFQSSKFENVTNLGSPTD